MVGLGVIAAVIVCGVVVSIALQLPLDGFVFATGIGLCFAIVILVGPLP